MTESFLVILHRISSKFRSQWFSKCLLIFPFNDCFNHCFQNFQSWYHRVKLSQIKNKIQTRWNFPSSPKPPFIHELLCLRDLGVGISIGSVRSNLLTIFIHSCIRQSIWNLLDYPLLSHRWTSFSSFISMLAHKNIIFDYWTVFQMAANHSNWLFFKSVFTTYIRTYHFILKSPLFFVWKDKRSYT